MLSFLLDEQISPIIAEQIQQKRPGITIFSLHNWQEGRFLGFDDQIILSAATKARLTLVTYDQNTIPPILVEWGKAETSHGGVIFIDYQSIPPHDFGRLVRSLIWLWDNSQQQDWQNRIIYLKPEKL